MQWQWLWLLQLWHATARVVTCQLELTFLDYLLHVRGCAVQFF